MDQSLKERLIGAAVLVLLGVWLIPWLLDGRQEQANPGSSTSALRLPAPDGPLPVRSQTLALDAAKQDPFVAQAPHANAGLATPTSAPDASPVASSNAPTAPPGARPRAGRQTRRPPRPRSQSLRACPPRINVSRRLRRRRPSSLRRM